MKFDLDIENINYIKILYKDRYNFTHCVKAAIKKLEEKYIFAGAKSEKPLSMEIPQEVSLSFICDNGLYKTKTKLNFVQFDEKDECIFFSLATPEEVEFQQNREYFRIQMQEKVVVSYKRDDEEVEIPAYIYDISANGIKIVLSGMMKFPEEVFLEIYLPSKKIKTSAKYVRTDDEDGICKASFHFIDLPIQDLDYISRLCLIKQLEQRRNSRA